MFWSLFVVTLITTGLDAGDSKFLLLKTYDTRVECEFAKANLLTMFEVPDNSELLCYKTDEA
tara:strand:+ start:432 stop:617 length:186 start_codon:yes stop_codon:yes gene_type:complete